MDNNIQYKIFRNNKVPSPENFDQIAEFLHEHLDEYGDSKDDIESAMYYSLSENDAKGGVIIVATENDKILGATVINRTGMTGYIPENILVYIAVHADARGKGIGKGIMNQAIEQTTGNIALHVEPENPAIHLYEKMGFTNKYLEMRLDKSTL